MVVIQIQHVKKNNTQYQNVQEEILRVLFTHCNMHTNNHEDAVTCNVSNLDKKEIKF